MKTVKEEIASNLLYYRKRVKLTQKDLADRIGVKNNTVSQWENGTNSIDVEVLFKICEILGVSINDMYGSYSRATESTFTPTETEFIHKFRELDERGKLSVTKSLEQEYSYLKENNAEFSKEFDIQEDMIKTLKELSVMPTVKSTKQK